MSCCPKQKGQEELEVPIAHAVTNVGAVVVVGLDAHAALAAVERPRRPQVLAGFAVA